MLFYTEFFLILKLSITVLQSNIKAKYPILGFVVIGWQTLILTVVDKSENIYCNLIKLNIGVFREEFGKERFYTALD